MKYFLFISLMTVTVTCKAQLFLISQPKQEIKNWIDTANNYHIVRDNVLTHDDKLPVFIELKSKSKSDQFIRFYFDSNDTCRVYRVMADAKFSVTYIKQLNDNYQKIGDNQWINKSNEFQIYTYIMDGIFIMDYSKI